MLVVEDELMLSFGQSYQKVIQTASSPLFLVRMQHKPQDTMEWIIFAHLWFRQRISVLHLYQYQYQLGSNTSENVFLLVQLIAEAE
jgi:hypothetical protein